VDFLDAAFGDAYSPVAADFREADRRAAAQQPSAAAGAAGDVWEWVKAHKLALLIIAGIGTFAYLTMAESGGSFEFFGDDGAIAPRRKLRRLRAPVAGMTDEVRDSALRVRKSAKDTERRRRVGAIKRKYRPVR